MAARTSTAKQRLGAYRKKRDFKVSPEPVGGRPNRRKRSSAKGLAYCVQKHQATRLHYDFRLEHHGVLLSWAVPRGPSLNPADKRLAIRTEDHPLDYGSFEGVIPEGYGAGVVMLWDRGTWAPEPAETDIEAALQKGEIKFTLLGQKLRGSWVLVRTGARPGSPLAGKENWLLIKHRDQWAQETSLPQDEEVSVKSGLGFQGILAASPKLAARLNQSSPRRIEEIQRHAPAKKRPATPPRTTAPKMGRSADSARVRVGKNEVTLTHLNKVLYPSDGTTKAEVLDYYRRIAPVLLPHLHDRPVSFKRFPDGVDGKVSFQKNRPPGTPPWVKGVSVASERNGSIEFCILNDLASLLWAGNLAALELHTYLHHADHLTRPTLMMLDLDPGLPATIRDCAGIALLAQRELRRIGLECFAKTSGGKGIHLCVPLNTPVTYDQSKAAAQTLALHLEQMHPTRVVSKMRKELRVGKVFIDWSQNDTHKTTVCAYSLRGLDLPSVSRPLPWEEVEQISRLRKAPRVDMSPARTLAQVEKHGDLLAPILKLRQRLPSA